MAATKSLWLILPVSLPETLGRLLGGRLLLNPTEFAGIATAFLAWRCHHRFRRGSEAAGSLPAAEPAPG